VATRGDINTKYLYILKALILSFKNGALKWCANFFKKSAVKVEIFGFLIFSRDRKFFVKSLGHFFAPGHSSVKKKFQKIFLKKKLTTIRDEQFWLRLFYNLGI